MGNWGLGCRLPRSPKGFCMTRTSTHLEVPTGQEPKEVCLGPDGSAAKVTATLALIDGRWKLPILFRLFAQPSVRFLTLLRDIEGVSQKMLTQHLRELERDGLVVRRDFDEKPRRVEYSLSSQGEALRPALIALRDFAKHHAVRRSSLPGQASTDSSL